MFAHNASNYDLHFMVDALGKAIVHHEKLYYHCLPKNTEVCWIFPTFSDNVSQQKVQ